MSEFDESKIKRDEHGRFSSGLAAFVAKNTGQLKLEKYKPSDKADLATWVRGKLQTDTTKATTPLDKYAASKHGIDVELVGMSKKSTKDVATTGDLERSSFRDGGSGGRWDKALNRAVVFTSAMVQKPRAEKEALTNDARKAMNARNLATEKLSKNQNEQRFFESDIKERNKLLAQVHSALIIGKMPSEKEKVIGFDGHLKAIEKYGQAQYDRSLTEWKEKLGTLQKEEKSLTKKVASTQKKMDGVFDKLGDAAARTQCAEETERALHTIGDSLQVHDHHEISLSIEHHREDGSSTIHLRGPTRTAEYPGEKSMSIHFQPGKFVVASVDKRKNIVYDQAHKDEKKLTTTITKEFPSNEKGKEHPEQGEHEIKGVPYPVDLRPHVYGFLESGRKP